jgi:Protein of unknown function (DUF4231)
VLITISMVIFSIRTFEFHGRVRVGERELRKLKEAKKAAGAPSLAKGLSVHQRYRDEVTDFIEDYRAEAQRNRRVHNVFQSVIIIGSLVTTSVTSAIAEDTVFKWAAVAISIMVGVSAGFTGYFKFRERGMNSRQTADAIEREQNAVTLGIRGYRGLAKDEALALFAEEVESLREEQQKREQQLDQPPEIRATHTTP